jgi:hypothetical protein
MDMAIYSLITMILYEEEIEKTPKNTSNNAWFSLYSVI